MNPGRDLAVLILWGVFAVVLATEAVAEDAVIATGPSIDQVPADATPVPGHADPSVKPIDDPGNLDAAYQNQVLSNPLFSAPARANVVSGQGGPGNIAVITQGGVSNTSTVVQEGDANYARQTQTGTANDLKTQQYGTNNRSDEQQTGHYNHKVIIQNGSESETLTIEQVPTPANE